MYTASTCVLLYITTYDSTIAAWAIDGAFENIYRLFGFLVVSWGASG